MTGIETEKLYQPKLSGAQMENSKQGYQEMLGQNHLQSQSHSLEKSQETVQETSSGGAWLHGVHIWSWEREKGMQKTSGRS